ncbi:hypothetical protein Tco_0614695 [Tanacetum coccineum]
MLNLRNSNQDHPVDLYDLKGSDDEDNEIDSLTKEPSDTLLMGDEVISTTPKRENDEFIKSSVDDLVPIPRESEVTSVCDDLECYMYVNTPLPTTNVREENFDINSPLGEYVVDFLMENVDVADLPRHLEFEDISSLDPPKSAPLNYEPLGNPDSVSRSLETSDLILEELTAVIGLDDLIPTEIDDGYYDSEGDILFLDHLLMKETFSGPIPAVIPNDREDHRACFQSSNLPVFDHLHIPSDESKVQGLAGMSVLCTRWQAVCQVADQVAAAGQSKRDMCPERVIRGVSSVCQFEVRHVQCVPMIVNKCSLRLLDLKALKGHVLSKCGGHPDIIDK